MATVSEAIRSARLRKKMSQAELAKKIGVSRMCVIDWESGKYNPGLNNYKALMKVLEVRL